MKPRLPLMTRSARKFITTVVIWICVSVNLLHAQAKRYVKPVASGTGDGSSWANASNDVQAMMNASSGGDSVFVAAGTYQVGAGSNYVLRQAVKVYGGFNGTETQLSQRNWVTNVTILKGNGSSVIYNNNSGITTATVLDGFTVRDGSSVNYGGGMYNANASPTIANCIFTANSSTGFGFGGGIANSSSNPVISNCTFTGNTSPIEGGAIYTFGACSPTITNCSFSNNSSGQGGAIENSGGATTTITNCTFNSNTAANGGGIYNTGSGTTPIIGNCIFTNNNAVYDGTGGSGGGGAMKNDNNATPSISNCTFTSNSAYNWGGAMYNGSGAPTINNCLFQTNSGKYGGALMSNGPGLATFNNCRFIGNSSSTDGGGIYDVFSKVKFYSCIFSSNSSQFGGGVFCVSTDSTLFGSCLITGNSSTNGGGGAYVQAATPKFANCGFSGNNCPAGGGALFDYDAGNPKIFNCIMWGNSSSIYNFVGSGINGSSPDVQYTDVEGGYAGTGNINANPLFFNAPSYTSAPFSTGDYRVSLCSPAIHAGNTALVPSSVTMDFVSNPRIDGSFVDIGAYESIIKAGTGNIIYVNKNLVPAGGDGESWTKAATQLSDVLRYAKANEGTWTAANPLKIFVAKGTYKPAYHWDNPCISDRDNTFILPSNVQVYGGFDPDNGIDDLGDPRIYGASGTILSGDIGTIGTPTDNCFHVLYATGAIAVAMLDGLTISDGYGDDVTNGRDFGGGLYNAGAAPFVTNCIFSNNFSNFGGAILNNVCAPTFTNCTFTNNSAVTFGGAVYNSGLTPVYTNCTFNGNTALTGSAYGGAMFNNASTATVNGCVFSTNNAKRGAAIYNYGASSPNLTGCTFQANVASEFGGAIFNETAASSTITGCAFSGNHSPFGGALLIGGMATVLNCGFSGNYAASYGGAVYNLSTVSPVYTNCTFSGNYITNAGGGGGGMFNNGPTASVVNCTFYGNTADFGGGIHNYGTSSTTVRNTIIWGNNSGIYNESTASASVQYSDVQGGYAGTGNMNVDPLFVNTASPIGPDGIWGTLDDGIRLQPCSPATNSGNNASITGGVTTDIGGIPRIQFTTVDLGAYEANSLANASAANLVSTNSVTSGWQLANGPTFYSTNCTTLEAAVTGDGTVTSIIGNTTAKVWIESSQPSSYVKRHYEITPDNNPSTATGMVTLYFTQAEFDAFNAINTTRLPQNPSDAAGKANLRIEKRSGTSNDGSGMPNTYSGSIVTIDPVDANIVWNATKSRWEISSSVTGFSGFFAKTSIFALPLHLVSFVAEQNNCTATLKWITKDETNVAHFEIEESADGISFRSITTIAAKNTGMETSYANAVTVMNSRTYYRLKMVDIDGRITYSPVLVVNSACASQVFVYPVPAKDRLYIRNAVIGSNYSIFDNSGKKIGGGRITSLEQDLSIQNISKGIYYISVQSAKGTSQLKFIKE